MEKNLQQHLNDNPELENNLRMMALDKYLHLPSISILCPTYNRKLFLPLFAYNVMTQTYPKHLLEVVIDDDGDIPFMDNNDIKNFEMCTGVKVQYLKSNTKRTIGQKRNNLVKKARHKIVCFMDDDDIYTPEYIEHSYSELSKIKGPGLVGSSQMLFIYPYLDYKVSYINCEHKYQIHEATMMFHKKYFNSMGGFKKTSKGEGASMIELQDKNVRNLDIKRLMCCVCHNNNTVDKSQFLKKEIEQKIECDQVNILKQILK